MAPNPQKCVEEEDNIYMEDGAKLIKASPKRCAQKPESGVLLRGDPPHLI